MRRFPARSVAAAGMLAASIPVLSPPQAQSLPYAPEMTCAAVSGLVQSQRAAVIRTAPHQYARYVAGPNLCEFDFVGLPTYVRTRDNPACMIGYECRNLGGRF